MPGEESALVSTKWLFDHLRDPEIRVVDATYFLPMEPRDAEKEFLARHVPGAVRFDIDAIKDPENPLPHMLPSASEFAAKVGALGLGDEARIVAYDAHGLVSAARAWWMFRVFGHDRAGVLDGGLPKWRREGRPVEAGPATPKAARFTPRLRPALVRSLDAVRAELSSGGAELVDARSRGRFVGSEPEFRAGLKSGHMPGAKNLPYGELFAADGTLLPRAEILARFRAAGVDVEKPVTTTCGSGVTACVLAFALYLAGKKEAAVYDGSWSDWGGRDDTEIATG
jgi:thiosulfate/3-mercaptopyruvate sulfurtransferase